MTPDAQTSNSAAESLLAFWRDAGVEWCVEDGPVDRTLPPPTPLRAVPKAATPAASPAAAPMAVDFSQAIAEAREAVARADTLEALAAEIAAFDGCGLKREGARQAVFSRGNPLGPVMIVGEGPGGEEDERGEPFVGRAGKLLDRMIAAAGLTGQVFITNTVFWRPPGNRTPTPQEQAVCAPFVEKAISLVNPKVLVLAGAASAKSMLRTNEGILGLRGQWREWRSEEGGLVVPALPILHPAFLLRQPAAKRKAWSDLLALAERLAELGETPVKLDA